MSYFKSKTGSARQAYRKAEERTIRWLLGSAATFSGAIVLLVIYFVVERSLPLLQRDGLAFLFRPDWDLTMIEAWGNPDFWAFGAWPLIVGTLVLVGGALFCSILLGTGCAVFLAELAPPAISRPFQSVLRLLAGVPSVVFGLIGLTVVVPIILETLVTDELALRHIDVPLDGTSILAGVLVLTFMILPFYVTVSSDALRAVPKSYREAGTALGLSRWRVIRKVVVPAALPGLLAGAVLASARGVGEAIAMSMVAGGLSNVPQIANGLVFFLEPVRGLASAIVESGGEGMNVPQVQAALFSLGSILLALCILLSALSRVAFTLLSRRLGLMTGRAV